MRELSLPSRGSFSRARFFSYPLLPSACYAAYFYTRLPGSSEQGCMLTINNCDVFFFKRRRLLRFGLGHLPCQNVSVITLVFCFVEFFAAFSAQELPMQFLNNLCPCILAYLGNSSSKIREGLKEAGKTWLGDENSVSDASLIPLQED